MLLSKVGLKNLLSFGDIELELRPLNVLIGANATGKSNLIRALGLVQSLPSSFTSGIEGGGGLLAWKNRRMAGDSSEVHLTGLDWSYELEFVADGKGVRILDEQCEGVFARSGPNVRFTSVADGQLAQISPVSSVFAEFKHPNEVRLGALAKRLGAIRLYQEFQTGPRSQARNGIASSALADTLSEGGSNLSLVLNELDVGVGLQRVNEVLNRFFALFSEVKVLTRGGITQLYVREEGVPDAFAATSLSDGTLRLLCLLAILLDPNPPPLICIEEPEIGLHPDAIQIIADVLIEASSRTQLVVTTHSPALVDAMTGQPESVVVCERDFDGCTEFTRLKKKRVNGWLERYTLGKLWQKGEIGGNRW